MVLIINVYFAKNVIDFLLKLNKLSKYSVSLDLSLIFLTLNILYCCHWELPQRSEEQWLNDHRSKVTRCSQRTPVFGFTCLSPCEVDPNYATHVLHPSNPPTLHICLQLTANQARPWPLIIHRQRVTFCALHQSSYVIFVYAVWQRAPADWGGRIVKLLLRFISLNGLPLKS